MGQTLKPIVDKSDLNKIFISGALKIFTIEEKFLKIILKNFLSKKNLHSPSEILLSLTLKQCCP